MRVFLTFAPALQEQVLGVKMMNHLVLVPVFHCILSNSYGPGREAQLLRLPRSQGQGQVLLNARP